MKPPLQLDASPLRVTVIIATTFVERPFQSDEQIESAIENPVRCEIPMKIPQLGSSQQ